MPLEREPIVRKQLFVLAALAVLAAPAFATPCVALEYQEMKDMSVNDLVVEACKDNDKNELNFKSYLLNIESSRGPKPFPDADKDYDVCKGQIERIVRVLNSKGITEKLPALCQQQAQGRPIAAPAESK
jgi:hypothetical protein